jgi:uncharacterized protein (TIGR02594 family)
MLYIPPWLELARMEAKAGVREVLGPDHNPRIIEYGTAVDLIVSTDEVPWCSDFINWLFMELGEERTRSARARSWLRWGIPLQHAALGCVMVLKRGGGDQPGPEVIDAPGHVGLLVDKPEPDTVTIIAGNQGNRVCEQQFHVERILGMRWPG